jgi:tetratricopeptide (TPR) repeat protein
MMGLAYRSLLFAVVLSGFLTSSYSQESTVLHPVYTDFDKALGSYAKGLLLFGDYRAEGMYYLTEAIKQVPSNTRFIDTWLEKAQFKILAETDFSDKLSDFTKHQRYILQNLYPIAKKNPSATYLSLKIIETAIALEQTSLAQTLAANTSIDNNDPYRALIDLKTAVLHNPQLYITKLNTLSASSKFKNNYLVQSYILRCYLKLNQKKLSQNLLQHSLQMIPRLTLWQKQLHPKICQLITNGVIQGSDIGSGAQEQLSDSFYSSARSRQWASLAAILMKLEHYSQAEVILKNFVIHNAEKKWRAYLSLSTCAYKMGKVEERLNYLIKASSLLPNNRGIKKSLVAAYLNAKKYSQADKLLNELRPLKDIRMHKIEVYINTALERYQTAFKQVEKIYGWPDPAEKLKALTVSFASYTAKIYHKVGKPGLLIKRLKQTLRYTPTSHELSNTIAYCMAEAKIDLNEAEVYIQKALQVEPNNVAYLDTYAWVKYQQKEYAEAWRLIKKAVDLDDKHSSVIILHAGDICLANDGFFAKSRARNYWLEALKIDPTLKHDVQKRLALP